MRKSGPFRSIRLCAYRVVGADSAEVGAPSLAENVPEAAPNNEGLAEAEGAAVYFVERKCQRSNSSEMTKADRRTTIQGTHDTTILEER
jgi:hypothetical protein